MDELEQRLARWRRAGLVTGSQADAIRAYERSRPRRVRPAGASQVAPAPPAATPATGAARSPAPESPFRPLTAERAEPLVAGLPFAPDGRPVGIGMGILAAIGIVVGIFSVTLDILVAPTHNLTGDLEDVLHLGASVLGAVGGFQMAMGQPAGRRLVLASLAINVVATVVLGFARLSQASTLLLVLLWIVLAALVVASRFGRSTRTFQG